MRIRLTSDHESKTKAGYRKTAFVSVSAGIVEVWKEVPGVKVEIINFDNLLHEEYLTNADTKREWSSLSPAAKKFVKKHNPYTYKNILERIKNANASTGVFK